MIGRSNGFAKMSDDPIIESLIYLILALATIEFWILGGVL